MSQEGFVFLHRKALDSRVFTDDWLWRLWSWCLMKACWKEQWKDGRAIKPGQFVCGRNQSADQLSVSPSKWYRGMQKLQEWGQISMEANNHFTVVTICNWGTYQVPIVKERTTDEQPVNIQRTAGEQPADTLEESKEGKHGEQFREPTVHGALFENGSPSKEENRAREEREKILAVFAHYRIHHPQSFPAPKSDGPEWKKIRARLRDGYTVEQLCEAIDGNHRSPWHCGGNDDQREYHALELIVRNGDKVNQFVSIPKDQPVYSQKTRRTVASMQNFVNEAEQ